MYLEPDAVRLHRLTEIESKERPAEEVINDSEVQELGDPRLIDGVSFEQCAHETFSEEFCVPSKGNPKTKPLKRSKHEGEIKREDLEYLCETILTLEERKEYWESRPDHWTDDYLVVFVYETVGLHVQCVERELVRISTKDVVAMLGPCLDSADSKNTVIKKVACTWSSHTHSGKADFQWELLGPYQTEVCPASRSWLPQRARSFLKTRTKAQKNGV